MNRRRVKHRAAAAVMLCTLAGTRSGRAQSEPLADPCGEDGPWRVGLGAGLGAGLGSAGALGVSAGLAATDTRDFSFATGALVGVGASTALSLVYGLYDGFTGCYMAGDAIAYSVPIVTTLVGSLLPVAIWGASDELGEPAPEEAAMELRVPLVRLRF